MKKLILSFIVGLPLLASAQTTILTENFDSYSDLDYAGVVSPWMGTWSGATGVGTDDCQVTSAEFSSLSNSIAITGPQAGGTIDAMVVFPTDYSTGHYQFTFKYKVASGMGGYFNMQSSGVVPGTAWMGEIFLSGDGTGTADIGGQIGSTFNYTNGAWIDVMIDCDLDADMAHLWIDGAEVGSGFQWSVEAQGGGTGANNFFGGVNFYSASGDPVAACEYYVDDLMLVLMPPSGAGIDEVNNTASMNVVPNPSNGSFSLKYSDMNMENANVSVVDLLGKTVYTKSHNVLGNGSLSFDLNLRNGVYFVSVSNDSTKMTKRVVVKK